MRRRSGPWPRAAAAVAAGALLLAAVVAAGGLALVRSIRGSDDERLAFELYRLSVDVVAGAPTAHDRAAEAGQAAAIDPGLAARGLLGYALIGGRGELLALAGRAEADPAIRRPNSWWAEGALVVYHRQITGLGGGAQLPAATSPGGTAGSGQGRQIALWFDPSEFRRGRTARDAMLYGGVGLIAALTAGAGLLAAGLIDAQGRLAEGRRLALLGQASRTIGHELQTPLTALDMHRQLARRKLRALVAATDGASSAGGDPSAVGAPADEAATARAIATHLDAIAAETDRIRKVMAEVRRLIRPETGAVEEIDLVAFLGEFASTLSLPGAQSLGAPLCDGRPIVLADRAQLNSALRNLALNAAQSQEEAGVTDPIRVELKARGRRYAVVEIVDRGGGISRAALRNAFDPYFSTKPEGSGLGLSLARSLARAWGGELGLRPRPEGGCAARLSIPLAGREAARA